MQTVKAMVILVPIIVAVYAVPIATSTSPEALAIESQRAKPLSKGLARTAWKRLQPLDVGADYSMNPTFYDLDIRCYQQMRGPIRCERESGSESGTWSRKHSKKWFKIFRKLRLQKNCGMGGHYVDDTNVMCSRLRGGRTPDCSVKGMFSK